MLVPGGFGVRGIEGKVAAVRHAREHRIPTLGLCLGLQCMVIDVARHKAGLSDANSAEFDPETPDPVIATMADQLDVVAGERDMGGTMRLGSYPAILADGSLVAAAYGSTRVAERHRHRYEVANSYRPVLEDAGLVFSGTSPDGRLVEFVELVARSTRSSSAPKRTRSSSLAQPERTRCSRVSSQPRCSARMTLRLSSARSPCPVAVCRSGPEVPPGRPMSQLRDEASSAYPVRRSTIDFRSGRVIDVRTDEVSMPGGATATRDVVVHPGAVGIIALDNAGQVLLIQQYRHPVGRLLWEPPAGLLDEPGEDPLEAAKRELYEEAHLQAQRWEVLLDVFTSPGMSDEAVRIYLARDVSPADRPRFVGENEEANLPSRWIPLDEAVRAAQRAISTIRSR